MKFSAEHSTVANTFGKEHSIFHHVEQCLIFGKLLVSFALKEATEGDVLETHIF